MTDAVFLVGRQLGGGHSQAFHEEKWVIPEPAFAPRFGKDSPLDGIAGGQNDLPNGSASASEQMNRAERRSAGIPESCRSKRALLSESPAAGLVRRRPAGAQNARPAVQRIDRQPAVVREAPNMQQSGIFNRFQTGVGEERAAGFFDNRQVSMFREIGELNVRSFAEHLAKLPDFSGIGAGDQE